MNSQVCANCRNHKPVNRTDNRLVTESCGHVKCMSCLLQETEGCVACLNQDSEARSNSGAASDGEDAVLCKKEQLEVGAQHDLDEVEDLSKKKKPETSHISIETDAGGKKLYVCRVCKKKFRARSQMVYHAYCNGQSKPYQCHLCHDKKTFAVASHYKYHMRVHRGERPYACDLCHQAFFQLSKLRRHKLQHDPGSRKHACASCGAAFGSAWALRKHALLHSGERPHACPVCARRFRDTSNLARHVRAHTGPVRPAPPARRHQCARCPQAFHSSKDLRRHAAVHSDAKPFRCAACGRHFRRKDNLERHVRNTHGAGTAASEPPAPAPPPALDIVSANTGRQSVIVAATRPYVHKMRRAACAAPALPPIDTAKFAELARQPPSAMQPAPRDGEIFKKILCDEPEPPPPRPPPHTTHWRKLKLNTNW